MIKIEQNIQTCGLLTELTNSQTDSFKIIQSHWKGFNEELKKYKLKYDYKFQWNKPTSMIDSDLPLKMNE